MPAPTLMLRRSWHLGHGQRSAAATARPLLPAMLAGALTALARAYRMRRDTRQLLAFSDHMLSDLGLGRGEIGRAVRVGRDWR